MLTRFGEEIWTAEGPSVSVAGFDYPTRMVVIRLSDGALFIWSPTALSSGLRGAVDLLGPVRHIVAPNTLHHRFIGDWQRAYPDAQSHAAPQLRAKRPDLTWDTDLDDMPLAAWSGDIDQVVVRGNRITTEVVFFHRRSRTAIFTDLIQHFDSGWFKGWRALVARLDLLTAAPTDRSPKIPDHIPRSAHRATGAGADHGLADRGDPGGARRAGFAWRPRGHRPWLRMAARPPVDAIPGAESLDYGATTDAVE